MTRQDWAVFRTSLLTLLLVASCSLHYSRSDYKYPPTAGPAELQLSISLLKQRVRMGEPFVVTVSMLNTTDSVCNWGSVGPSGFQLIGPEGDTWYYQPYDWAIDSWGVGGPPPFFGVQPHDSVYWHYALWPQRFFSLRDTVVLSAGSYAFVGTVNQRFVLKDRTFARMPFMPSETIPATIVPDSDSTCLGPYRSLLDRWFDGRRIGGDWDKKKAAGETLLTIMQSLPFDDDSFMLALGYQLADLAEFDGHWAEALPICESTLARHPSGMLAEDLAAELPKLYQMTQRRQIADSLVRVFVSEYPRNAAALAYDEGRWLWYERTPVPPTWYRQRRLFLGLPGPWSAWREEKPFRLHSVPK